MNRTLLLSCLLVASCCDREAPRVGDFYDFSNCCSLEVARIVVDGRVAVTDQECVDTAHVSLCVNPTHNSFLLRNSSVSSISLNVSNTTYRDEAGDDHPVRIYRPGENQAVLPERAAFVMPSDDFAVIAPSEKGYVVALACRDSAWFEEPLIPWQLSENWDAARLEVARIQEQKPGLALKLVLADPQHTEIVFEFIVEERP